MSYVHAGRQYVVIAAGGHAELGTARSDALVAFALRRHGDPPAPLLSVLLDQPGRRFSWLAAGVALGIGLLVLAAWRLRRMRGTALLPR